MPLLVKLDGTSDLWMGEPDSAVNCSVEYAARELGADAEEGETGATGDQESEASDRTAE